MKNVPANWHEEVLGELCEIKTGRKDVNEGNPDGQYPFFTCAKDHTYSDVYSFDGEALLVAGNGDVGKVSYYDGKFEAYQRTYVLMGFARIVPRFLFLLLDGTLKTKVSDQKLGNTMPYIKKGMLTEFMVPLPPLPEQKRIVAILDEAFAAIDKAIANTEKNLANARELFESYLNNVFTQKGEGWVEKKLGEVCTFQGGSQPPKSFFSKEQQSEFVRFIQIRDYKSNKHIVYIPKEKARRFCSAEDVMIGRYGPPLFQILRGIDGAYNVALMKAIPTEEYLSKDFLYYFLKNGNILRYIINASNRAAGQIGLNKATLEPYPIAFPDKTEQARVVVLIETIQKKTQCLLTSYQQKLTLLTELKQSILQKAFSGELTAETVQRKKSA